MNNERLLLRLGRFFIYIAIASPVVWSLKFLFPYAAPQVFFFQAATTLATFAYIWLAIISPHYRPKWNLLIGATTIYIALQALTLIGSIEPVNSFIGAADRMMGIWNYFHYYLFFLVTTGLFRNAEDIKKLVVATVLTSLAASIRFFGTTLDFFNQNVDVRFLTTQVPFGNSSFFGNYLAITMPFALWLALEAKKRGIKIFWLGILIINFYVILRLGSRAALVGIVIAAIIWITPLALKNKKIRIASLSAVIVLILGMSALIANKNSAFVQYYHTLTKFSDWSINDSSNSLRFTLAKIGWEAFKIRPFLGWGHENFGFAFERHYDPKFAQSGSAEAWSDRVHNNFIHILATTGIVGLLSYIILLGTFWYILIKKFRNKTERPFTIILGLGLLIYSIQVFFSFDSPGSVLPLYSIFAVISLKFSKESDNKPQKTKSSRILFPIAGALSIGALAITHVFLTIQPLRASYYASEALYVLPFQYEEFAKNIENFERNLPNSMPIKGEFYSIIMQNFDFAARLTKQHPRINKFEEFVLPKVFAVSAQHPSDVRLQHRIGTVLVNRVFRGTSDVNIVINFWEAFLQLSPDRQYVIEALSNLYSYKKDYDKTIELLDRMIALNAAVDDAYWAKGKALMRANRIDEARIAFVNAYKAGYFVKGWEEEQIAVANLFIQGSAGLEYAVAIYTNALLLHPQDVTLHSNIAVAYAKQGYYEKAREHARTALSLAPETGKAAIEKFLKSIEGK